MNRAARSTATSLHSRLSDLARSRLADIAGWLLTAAALAAILVRTVSASNGRDFGYVYAAGAVWRSGSNPYGDAFQAFMRSEFYHNGSWPTGWLPPDLWVYPFQWISIAVPFGLLPFGVAAPLWKIVTALGVTCAVWLMWRCSDALKEPAPMLLKGAFALAVASSSSAHTNFNLGQTGWLVFLGFACTLHGILRESRWIVALGLTLLLLKPQYGLAILLMVAAGRSHRVAVLWAVAATVVMALPALFAADLASQIGSYMQNIASYVQAPANSRRALTGIGQLLAYAGLPPIPGPAYTAVGAVLGVVLVRLIQRHGHDPLTAYWCAFLVVLIFLPKHGSDVMLLFSILLLMGLMDVVGWLAALIGTGIMYRPYNLFGWAAPGTRNNEWLAQYYGLASVFLLVALWRTLRSTRS